ncbi:MAG TPA: DEAD/DEAH box helicase, partial [Cyclobacteriaceae bacterium]|nr:DEAD/DEAH box helicase [Cyclobacteriaceae bacterium]
MASPDIEKGLAWFASKGWKPFAFQLEAWESYGHGVSGLVNAPTGSGKTFSLLVPILLEGLTTTTAKHLQSVWITPIRALGKEIEYSAKEAVAGLDLSWRVGVRTGDSLFREKQRQLEKPPEFLITTPESLHLLLAQKNYSSYFKELKSIVVDEWHELIGSKRGVLMELALSRLKTIAPGLKIWGISATIGNMEESMHVLLGDYFRNKRNIKIIRSDIEKKTEIISVFPDEVERLPWSGYLGIALLEKIIPIILQGKSTLIFTNTRSFAEIWYQKLLAKAPELSGAIAMHHGSISAELRNWVEDRLHEGKLKAVVCT